MRLLILFASLLFFLNPQLAIACSCIFSGGFFEVAPEADAVFEAKVLSQDSAGGTRLLSMQVELHSTFTERELPRVVTIWGDNGYQCRRSISEFEVGSTWIFAVHELKESPNSSADFSLSVCGEYVVKRQGVYVSGVLKGDTYDAKEKMVFAEFKARLSKALKDSKDSE